MRAKHSVLIRGKRTSVSLETVFFEALWRLAAERSMSLNALITHIDQLNGGRDNLSSAVRVYLFEQVRAAAKERAA